VNRSGIKTTEFWTTAVSQLLTVLALVGLIGQTDLPGLQDALGKCVAAAAVFVTNAWVIVRYIQSRTQVKQSAAAR
jgi:hypothetical protein